jgi:hypothetical protein
MRKSKKGCNLFIDYLKIELSQRSVNSYENYQIFISHHRRGVSDSAVGHLYVTSANRGVAFQRQHGGELLCGKSAVFQIAGVGIHDNECGFFCHDRTSPQNTFKPHQYAQQAILDAADQQAGIGQYP